MLKLIIYFLTTIQGFTNTMFLNLFLPYKYKFWQSCAMGTLAIFCSMLFDEVTLTENTSYKLLICSVIYTLVLIFFFNGTAARKIFAAFACLAWMVSLELTTFLLMFMFADYTPNIKQPYSTERAICMAVYFVMQLASIYMIKLVRSKLKNKNLFITPLSVIVAIGQATILTAWTIGRVVKDYETTVFLGVASVFIMLAIDIIAWRASRTATNKRLVEEELFQAEKLHEADEQAYAQLDKKERELSLEIKAFKDELLDIKDALLNCGASAAYEKLCAFSSVSAIAPKTYAAGTGVSAICSKFAESCNERGIKYNLKIEIPQTLDIKDVHLCSLFSNILDNALNAAAIYEGEENEISFSCIYKNSNLVIQCKNYFNCTQPATKSGYGKLIIQDIVNIYNGIYEAKDEAPLYTLRAAIPLSLNASRQITESEVTV